MQKTLLAVAVLAVASAASAQPLETLGTSFAGMSAVTRTFKTSVARSLQARRDLQKQVERAVKKDSPGIVKVNISAYISISKEQAIAAMAKQMGVPMPDLPDSVKKERVYRNVAGSGSGFVVSKDAQGRPLIVTNAHVVDIVGRDGHATPEMLEGMDVQVTSASVTIELNDGNVYSASVLGFNHAVDLALVRLNTACPSCGVLKLSDDRVAPGEFVLAIGAPFGLSQSVSFGVVSNVARDVPGEGLVDDFIQTDVAINPGNSGGPLVDMKGNVVGVTNMGLSPNGSQVGINFAIPVHYVRDLLTRYQNTGAVDFARAGVTLQQQANGEIVVVSVADGAKAAGLEPGDVVVSVDGKTFGSLRDLVLYVASKVPGSTAVFAVSRSARLVTVSVPTTEIQ